MKWEFECYLNDNVAPHRTPTVTRWGTAYKGKRETVEQLVENIVSSISPLRNTHDEVVNKGFDTLYKNTEKLKVYLDNLKDYRSSADKIRERRL